MCLRLRDIGTGFRIRIEELEAKLREETEGRKISEERAKRERLKENEDGGKALAIEKLGKKEGLAKWKSEMMKEPELERQLWKRMVGELRVELEKE